MEVPSGTIILWKNPSTIPDGWSVYQPAVGRFLMGVVDGYSAGTTGGMSSHTHTAGGIVSGGAHTHTSKAFNYSNSNVGTRINQGSGMYVSRIGHDHDASFSLLSGGSHGHTLASSTTGGASNLPPYKVAIYIIKD